MRDWSESDPIEAHPEVRNVKPPAARLRNDTLSYSQLFANSGLNSHSPVKANATGTIREIAQLEKPSHEQPGRSWRLPPHRIIALGDRMVAIDTPEAKLWQVSLDDSVRLSAPWAGSLLPKDANSDAFGKHALALRPAGLDYIFGDGPTHTIVINSPEYGPRATTTPGHSVLPPGAIGLHLGFGETTEVVSLLPLENDFIVVRNDKHLWRDADFPESVTVRRGNYVRGSARALWQTVLNGTNAFTSPALSNHTFVIHLPRWLVTIEPATGAIIGELPITLLGNRLAADHFDRLWGFHRSERGVHLIGLLTEGTTFFYEPLGENEVDHPPVCFPDGRVCAITRSSIRCFLPDGTTWTFSFPTAERKTATATDEGDLFVAGGTEIVRIDAKGVEAWRAQTPDKRRITTNIAVTQDGSVCFAADHVLYCMEREQTGAQISHF